MFEFDTTKSDANKAKHGIDFIQAQALWKDDASVEIRSKQLQHSEERRLRIGGIGKRIWVAIVTHRGEAIRIMSVRRARADEVKLYEQARTDRS